MSAFSRHFTSIGPSLGGKIEGKLNDDPTSFIPSMKCLLRLNLSPLLSSMYLLRSKDSRTLNHLGPDRVSAKILKDAEELISNPLKDTQ